MREVAAIDFIDCNVAATSLVMLGHRRHCHGLFRLYLIHRIKYFAMQTNSKACGFKLHEIKLSALIWYSSEEQDHTP